MHLFRLIPPLDYRATVGYLGVLVRRFAMLLAVPVAVAIVVGDPAHAGRLAGAAGVAVLGGTAMARRRPPELGAREALVITALIYPVGSLVAAPGFWGSGSVLDLWFEAVSGLTTTGLSALDPSSLGYAERFLRSYLQWLGGAGIIVVAAAILGLSGGPAHRLFFSERSSESLRGTVASATRTVMRVYGGATVGLLIAYTITTRALSESVLLTMSTISTGGFSASPTSPGAAGTGVLVVAFVGMLLGATTFTLLQRPGRIARDWQFRGFVGIGVAGMALFALSAGFGSGQLFDAVSALTTTGFSMTPVTEWPASQQIIAVTLMVVGGMAGSTAGGVKIYRVLLAARLVKTAVLERVLPREAVVKVKYEGSPVTPTEIRSVGVFLLAYVAVLTLGVTVLTFSGLEVGDALLGSSSALGTVGLWSAAPIAGLSAIAKAALMGMMWAGRLELMAVLVVLYPGTWRHRGRRPSEL